MTSIAVTCAVLAGAALTGTLVEGGRRRKQSAPSAPVPKSKRPSSVQAASVPINVPPPHSPRTLVLAPHIDDADHGSTAAGSTIVQAHPPANLVSALALQSTSSSAEPSADMAQLPPHLRRYVDPNAPVTPPLAEPAAPIGPVKPWYDPRRTDATCQNVGETQVAGSVSWADPRHAPQERYEYIDQPRVKLTRTFGNDGRRLPVEGNTFHHPTGKQKRAYPVNGREADNFLRRMTGHDPHRKARAAQLAPTFLPDPPPGVVPGGGAFMSDRERDIQSAVNPNTIGDGMLPFVRPDIHQWQEQPVSYKKPTPQVRTPILPPSRAGLLIKAEPIGERRLYDDALPYEVVSGGGGATMRPADHHEIGADRWRIDARKTGGTVKDVVRNTVGRPEPMREPTTDEDVPIPRGMEPETYTAVKTVHKKLQQPHTLAYGATYYGQDTEDGAGYDLVGNHASLEEDRCAHRHRLPPTTSAVVHGALTDDHDTGATIGHVPARSGATHKDERLTTGLEQAKPVRFEDQLELDHAPLGDVGTQVQEPQRQLRAQKRVVDASLDARRQADVDDNLLVEQPAQSTTAHRDQVRAPVRAERERRAVQDQRNALVLDATLEDTANVYRTVAPNAGDRVQRVHETAERRTRANVAAFADTNQRRRADDDVIAEGADSGRDPVGTRSHRAAAAACETRERTNTATFAETNRRRRADDDAIAAGADGGRDLVGTQSHRAAAFEARERRLTELRDRAAALRGTHISAAQDGGDTDEGLLDGRSTVTGAGPRTEQLRKFERNEQFIVNRPPHRLDALVQNDGTDDRHYYMPSTQARPTSMRERYLDTPLNVGHGAVDVHDQNGDGVGDRSAVHVGVSSAHVREQATQRAAAREAGLSAMQQRGGDDFERFEADAEAERVGTYAHRPDRAWREQMMEPRVDNPDSDVLSAAVFGGTLNDGGVREQRTDRIMRREQMDMRDNLDDLHTHMIATRMDPDSVVAGTLRPMAQVHAENREASLRARLRAETPPPLSMIENNARFRALGVHHQRRSPTPPGSPRRCDSPVYAGQRVVPV